MLVPISMGLLNVCVLGSSVTKLMREYRAAQKSHCVYVRGTVGGTKARLGKAPVRTALKVPGILPFQFLTKRNKCVNAYFCTA